MRVLVVDDDAVTSEIILEDLRQFGYDAVGAADGQEAFDLIRTGQFHLVISDWQMPKMSGLELCREIRKRQWSGYVYIILLTSRSGVENVVCGLDAGADDFLSKPFHPQELRMRLRTGERILSLESRDLVIFAMAKLAEFRDKDTGTHLERMREYSRLLATELSRWPKYANVIDGDYVQLIYLTSPLHDIGKVGIPDAVLLKPGRLSPEEFELMKQHSVLGGNTLRAVAQGRPQAQFLVMAQDIAMTHHERYDGQGYPNQLRAEEIPLCGRIVALADVYDALRSKRVYKGAFGHDTARDTIVQGSGRQFDPDVVQAFLNSEKEFIAVANRFQDDGPLTLRDSVKLTAQNNAVIAPVDNPLPAASVVSEATHS
ncbi:MAG TPA: response regulator [Pirellulales bacterium]|jgi:putative two-component system response regulator|nr:response regulator [Pirellulales bacterium]